MAALEGRVAIITGGASGIGAAAARAFVAAGAKVVVADINDEAGAGLARELEPDCAFRHVDHTDRSDNAAAVELAIARFGKLDILFNNAGTAFLGRFEGVDDDELDRVIGINLLGPFRMTQAALPALREGAKPLRGGAAIVFTSSLQGISARSHVTPYTAAKHGIVGLTRGLALELARDNIRVNAVCPVTTDTPMLRQFMPARWDDADFAAGRERAREAIPLKRIAAPEDSARAALFLASEDAGMITGVALPVDGGITVGPQ